MSKKVKSFDAFKESFARKMEESLPKGFTVDGYTTLVDVNRKFEALAVTSSERGNQRTIAIDVSHVFEMYCNSMEKGLNKKISEYVNEAKDILMNDLLKVKIPDKTGFVKDSKLSLDNFDESKLFLKLINTEASEEYLQTIPHEDFQDLSIIFAYNLGVHDNLQASSVITNQMMNELGITKDVLMEKAKSNFEFSANNILNFIGTELTFEDVESQPVMIVLSNSTGTYGASAMLFTDKIADLCEHYNFTNPIILPSSIHETLLVDRTEEMTTEYCLEMIKTINEEVVGEQETLSNSMYAFDPITKEYTIISVDKEESYEREDDSDFER